MFWSEGSGQTAVSDSGKVSSSAAVSPELRTNTNARNASKRIQKVESQMKKVEVSLSELDSLMMEGRKCCLLGGFHFSHNLNFRLLEWKRRCKAAGATAIERCPAAKTGQVIC